MRGSPIAAAVALLCITGFARAQSHVTCVGDSITQGDGASAPSKAYPSVLQRLLGAGYAVGNDGHSGATLLKAGDLPYWTTAEYTASTTWSAKGGDVVIQLGTNDSKPPNWAKKASLLADCKALVDHYRAASSATRVWISLPPPATTGACCTIDGAVIDHEILPLLKQCAVDMGATTIDVHDALVPHTDWLVDGVHPNDQGAALIAQVVHDTLVKLPTVALAASPAPGGPAAITLTATPTAAYGKVEKVRILEGTTPAGELTSAPWALTLSDVSPGRHVYTAQVVETAGRTATSGPVSVDVDADGGVGSTKVLDAGSAVPPGTLSSVSTASPPTSGPEDTESPASAGGCASSPRAGEANAVSLAALGFALTLALRTSRRPRA